MDAMEDMDMLSGSNPAIAPECHMLGKVSSWNFEVSVLLVGNEMKYNFNVLLKEISLSAALALHSQISVNVSKLPDDSLRNPHCIAVFWE